MEAVLDDVDASVEEDAWQTRTAAVRPLAENHAPDLGRALCPQLPRRLC
ncbi:hypothetical protein ACQPZP_22400 [Spirillospora sp. CA-142024]